MKKKHIDRELDHYQLKAMEMERKLYLCLGWIAAQHNLHPLAPEVLKATDETKWGNAMPMQL